MTNKNRSELDKRIEYTKTWLDTLSPWLVGACVALTSQWAAPAIQDIIEKGIHQEKFKHDLCYIAAFFLSLWVFAKITKQHFKARTKELQVVNNPEQCSHLILFLSTTRPLPSDIQLKNNGLESLKSDLEIITKHKEAETSNNKRPGYWAWEMPLRAIQYHIRTHDRPVLKKIIIVCSEQSLEQYPEFQKIITNYLKDSSIKTDLLLKTDLQKTYLDPYSDKNSKLNGIDFEDFDDLTKHLHNAINTLSKKGVKREQIMIDFTSGQKVTSVVAATLTYNSNIKAQYISTKTLQVKGYDIVYGTAKIPELS